MPGIPDFAAVARWTAEERAEREAVLAPLLEGLRKTSESLTLASLPASTAVPRPPVGEGPQAADVGADPFQAWRKQRTATEWAEFLLREIRRENPRWNAFSRVQESEALEAAQRADAGRSLGRAWGLLHGIPVAIKDNIAVKGWPHTGSSAVLAEQTAAEDATVITRLRYAGAVLIGQTVMHELAFGMTTINPHLGAVRNPWDPERICGGSSGGSGAAVAAGLVPLALGTDTGGSVRCPATLCGVVGFKPTFGAVSRYGVVPLGGSLDTVGPMARTVAQCLAAHLAMAGEDPRDEATLSRGAREARPAPTTLEGMRIGMPRGFFDSPMETGVRREVERSVDTLRKAGARVEPVAFPDLAAINNASLVSLLAEAGAFFAPQLVAGKPIGPDVRGRLEQGLLVPAVDYLNAQRLRARWMAEVDALFTECDLLLTPASPVVPPRIEDPYTDLGGERVDARTAVSRFLRSFNFLGLPGLALPCGLTDERLPVGIQLVGPGFSDEWLLRAGTLAESAIGFDELPPGVAR